MKKGLHTRLLATMLSAILIVDTTLVTASPVSPHAAQTTIFNQQAILPAMNNFENVLDGGMNGHHELAEKAVARLKQGMVTTSDLSPVEEIAVLEHVLAELKKELEGRGNADLPLVVAISDQHGAVERFDALVLHAMRRALPNRIPDSFIGFKPDLSYAEQLAAYGVSLSDFHGKLTFFFNGDLMHRGEFGMQVFRHVTELYKAGITGNHDFMQMLSAAGYHLPSTQGYRTYGFADENGSIDNLLQKYRTEYPALVNNPIWWAERWAIYQEHQDEQQHKYWGLIESTVAKLYSTVSNSLKGQPERQRAWDKLRGFYLVPINTGVRAVGSMSMQWWNELAQELELLHKAMVASGFQEESLIEPWCEAIELIYKVVLPGLKKDFDLHVADGDWWWRVFEGLNYGNYRTVEWYAKDATFHHGWEPYVYAELSNEGAQVTSRNYLMDSRIQDIAAFYKRVFSLHLRDIYQLDYLHALLPVDRDTGEIYFTYKGIHYRGAGRSGAGGYRPFQEGLAVIAHDIRTKPYADIGEALSLIMSWYADMTTKSKPPDVIEAMKGPQGRGGPKAFLAASDSNGLVLSHTPLHEYDKGDLRKFVNGMNTNNSVFLIDHGMAPGYGGRGVAMHISPEGIEFWGFRHKESKTIERNPPTVKELATQPGEQDKVIFENVGVPKEIFLPQLIRNIEARIAFLRGESKKIPAPQGVRGIMVGIHGGGKSTQGKLLADRYGVPYLESVSLLRQIPEALVYIKELKPVPDDIVIRAFQAELSRPEYANGFILDGFPRTDAQLKWLQEFLTAGGQHIDFVLNLQVTIETAIEHLLAREPGKGARPEHEVRRDFSESVIKFINLGSRLFRLMERTLDTEFIEIFGGKEPINQIFSERILPAVEAHLSKRTHSASSSALFRGEAA